MSRRRRAARGGLALLLAFALHAASALSNQGVRASWPGVPSPPPPDLARAMALGDPQLFYRAGAFGLQNLGDEAGPATPLAVYDYVRLGGWLELLDQLDPDADYAPVLAGFYFSHTPVAEDLRRIVVHLLKVGARDPIRNWRWLTHAVYLARHQLHDLPLAIEVARHLATLEDPRVPLWVRQLPAFVLADVGEVEAARDLFQAILASDGNLDQGEARFMRRYLAERLADPSSPGSPAAVHH